MQHCVCCRGGCASSVSKAQSRGASDSSSRGVQVWALWPAWGLGPALDAVLPEHPQLAHCTTTSTAVHPSALCIKHSVQACLVMGPAQRSTAGAGHVSDGAACVHNDSEGSRRCSQLQCGVEVPAQAEAGVVCSIASQVLPAAVLQGRLHRGQSASSAPKVVCAGGVDLSRTSLGMKNPSRGASTERRRQQG